MPLLPRFGILQNGELRRCEELCWYVSLAFPHPSNQADASEERLLQKEPSNLQAQSLSNLIEEKATRGEPSSKQPADTN
jgi:hypothetical protein